MKYVTSFVHPVPKKKLDIYRRSARKFAKLWKEHGALEVTECVADDIKAGKRSGTRHPSLMTTTGFNSDRGTSWPAPL